MKSPYLNVRYEKYVITVHQTVKAGRTQWYGAYTADDAAGTVTVGAGHDTAADAVMGAVGHIHAQAERAATVRRETGELMAELATRGVKVEAA